MKSSSVLGYALAAPAVFLLMLLHIFPIAALTVLSFTNYELGAVSSKWVGLENFSRALADPVLKRSLSNTALYVGVVLPASVVLGLLFAVLIHGRTKSRSIYEVIYFLPVTSTLIAMATVWQFLLHPKLGPVNALMHQFGIEQIAFLSTPAWTIPTMAAIGVWQLIGFNMILFLAGLSSIPRELYDAAAVDGFHNGWDRFSRITWPMLGPTTLFVVVTTTITSFKVFDTVAVLTQGKGGSEVLLYAIYLEGFQYFRIGYAAAATLAFLGLILVFSLVQTSQFEKRTHYA